MFIKWHPDHEGCEEPQYHTVTDFVRERTMAMLFGIIEGQPSYSAKNLQILLDTNFPSEFRVSYENWKSSEFPMGSLTVTEIAIGYKDEGDYA
jgi:hypothetical protein